MKVCPVCRLRYEDATTHCLVDGAALDLVQDPRIGAVLAGRYTIEGVLGRGGMATVYRAHHALARRHVAVKVLHDRFVEDEGLRTRLQREAQATKQLAHPNIVEIYDYGLTDELLPFLVMELLEGDPLDQVLKRRGALPPKEVVALGLQIARGLSRAHDFGVVHRDVKPENVFVCRSDDGQPVVKLVDFGIALSPDDPRLTGTGQLLGSPRYMAPERFQDRARVMAVSDLYSLGVVLFELVTGDLPFHSESMAGYILAHLETPAPRVSERVPSCPPALDRLIGELLAKQPAHRPVDAHAVVSALSSMASENAKRVRRVSAASQRMATPGEALRLDHWTARARTYQEMLDRVWPGHDVPLPLQAMLAELHATIGRLKALRKQAQEVEQRLEASEERRGADRERLGKAVDSLAQDLSRARSEERRQRHSTVPGPYSSWADAYRGALRTVIELDAQDPEHPQAEALAALETATNAYREWLAQRKKSGAADV
ncbi:MAG TPA: serine/threonine-protein kinase, partial [Polyangiaceae bacterium LLY-WYZ-15_(1-7)]|nr:serine/threonine-protein kinase [Polyangiaceae bacterium LLY-WYZ-15_(1-7)]